jgi:luciferase family oxidoreductase group 1
VLPLSVLDLAPVSEGSSARDALRDSVDLAQLCERLGYVRFWFAEHHGMPNIACSAPEILIEHVASATSTIRVGSGGIMLPNHTPLSVAENFHTLATLHPGRIDLGIGRAPGTDPATSRMLRLFDAEQFPQQLQELLAVSRRAFPAGHPFATVRVIPEGEPLPPIWVLASSGETAAMAGSMGLGYGFARHFSPAPPGPAIRAYRAAFAPSDQFPAPHVITSRRPATSSGCGGSAATCGRSRVRMKRRDTRSVRRIVRSLTPTVSGSSSAALSESSRSSSRSRRRPAPTS